ncbi:hypothetical protein AXF42_Ash007483 [Apostasia shenzhenica]|uniref:Uncharacterized protein n=1 Tax=Apostasia shenzhenica TaxID=1088818 RepID=A0A2I0A5K0_9ASPA|nr:hypothetical protein AXF42_Ash007483 [Apostasia shenzhenica]
MVRVLVATAIREAVAGVDSDALIKLMDATCRRATAPPAPPDGLCLVDMHKEFIDDLVHKSYNPSEEQYKESLAQFNDVPICSFREPQDKIDLFEQCR